MHPNVGRRKDTPRTCAAATGTLWRSARAAPHQSTADNHNQDGGGSNAMGSLSSEVGAVRSGGFDGFALGSSVVPSNPQAGPSAAAPHAGGATHTAAGAPAAAGAGVGRRETGWMSGAAAVVCSTCLRGAPPPHQEERLVPAGSWRRQTSCEGPFHSRFFLF